MSESQIIEADITNIHPPQLPNLDPIGSTGSTVEVSRAQPSFSSLIC
jgi:hypothetical protein